MLLSCFPGQKDRQLVCLAYHPLANNAFLSEQTSHPSPTSNTFLSEQISTSNQPPPKRTDRSKAMTGWHG
jgi:hypothetical protein